MDLDDLHFLLSDDGQQLLAATAVTPLTDQTHLQLASRLRTQWGPARAHAVLETIILRGRAAAKFSRAPAMYFTRQGLEQASAEPVARYRARRFAALGARWLADLGCGIGGDALALAGETADNGVIGVDRSPLRLAMARANVRAYGEEAFHPVQADLRQLPPLPVDALFFDPGRRDERGRRLHRVEQYRPPLSLVDHWLDRVPDAAVKISPGVDYAELPAAAEVEFISVEGEVKEAVLWYGRLRNGNGRRATLLSGDLASAEPVSLVERPLAAPIPVTPPQQYLYEPDGAVIRAHLVEQLAEDLAAAQLDPTIAYLTAATPQATPFARCFVVEDHFPFQLKRLRRYLRARGVGQVTIKKRGSPLELDALRRQLRLAGEAHRVIFLTRVMGEATVLIGQEWTAER